MFHITGGYSETGLSEFNAVTINSGTSGDKIVVSGGQYNTGLVSFNNVTINGGSFSDDAVVAGASAKTGTVTNNNLIITGGTYDVGTIIAAAHTGDPTGTILLNGNTITLDSQSGGTLNLTDTTLSGVVHGGLDTTADERRTDNRLIIASDATVGDIQNFENYDFHFDKSTDAPMLKANNIDLGDDANLIVRIADHTETIASGSTLKLLDETGGLLLLVELLARLPLFRGCTWFTSWHQM